MKKPVSATDADGFNFSEETESVGPKSTPPWTSQLIKLSKSYGRGVGDA